MAPAAGLLALAVVLAGQSAEAKQEASLEESPTFDCSKGRSNWKLGWSKAKQLWCCKQQGLGCGDAHSTARTVQPPPRSPTHWQPAVDRMFARTEECGVSAVLGDNGRFHSPATLQPMCDHHMTTNCSVSYQGMRCPSGCDFLVPNHHFVCAFECVPADRCSVSNSNRAFPDPVTGLCKECALAGCHTCGSPTACDRCHPGFTLRADGSGCDFALDTAMHTREVMVLAKVVVGLIILGAILWLAFYGTHDKKVQNMEAIERGRRHRRLCKVQDWQLGSNRMVRQRYDLTVNVHRKHILGVGLPLFYNSICFLALIALIFCCGTFAVFRDSGLATALSSSDRSPATLLDNAMHPAAQAPALILSPLAVCGDASARDVMEDMRYFAGRNFHTIGVLYIVTFVLSLLHGKMQLKSARQYDADNRTMADFALRVTGLKPELVDEHALTDKLQEAFNKAAQTDTGVGQQAGAQLVGVSVCYNYAAVQGEVDAMRDRLVERMDVDLHQKVKAAGGPALTGGGVGVEHTSAGDAAAMRQQVAEDRKQAAAWFDPASPEQLASTGELFAVFQRISDRDAAWRACARAEELLQDIAAPGASVKMHEVFTEPPSVNWWHLSVTPGERNTRIAWAAFKILAIIAAVQVLIVMPFAYYIVWPYSVTGSSANGAKMQIAGVILGNVNMFVSLQIFFTSYGLGFHRKTGMDTMIICANTGLVMVNTFFNLGTTALMVFSQQNEGQFGLSTLLSIESLVAIGVENSLASNIYKTLVPGTFFVGYMMCIVMAGVVPFVWNTILMKTIYVWRCLPDSMLNTLKVFLPWAPESLERYPFRRAERGFEPMEIGISWDYTASIVNPTVCFTMLFFVSHYVWHTFLMMFLWTCFYYCFCRYQHLRFCKACYYTSNCLDTTVNFLWGVPLSVVAAAWCAWGLRSGQLAAGATVEQKFALVAASFFGSAGLWVLAYRGLLDPYRQRDAEELKDATFDTVKADTLYTWFNCNPVYVLKSEYYTRHSRRTPCYIAHGHGALKVHIESATGLRSADHVPFFGGASDPYCVCEIVGKPKVKCETRTVASTANPRWGHVAEFLNYTPGDALQLTVFDRDTFTHSDCLGKVIVPGDTVRAGFDEDLELDNCGHGRKATIRVRVEPALETMPQTTVTIQGAHGLRDADWLPFAKGSDPYCVCQVAGKPDMEVVTMTHSNTSQPVWNFTTGLDLDDGDQLVFKVMDKDLIKRNDTLGTVTVTAAQIREGVKGPLPLDGGAGKAVLEVEIRAPVGGQRHRGSSGRGSILACGEDANQVRYFEVGKEYLFVTPDKQAVAMRDLEDVLEVETYLECLLAACGRLAAPFSRFASAPKSRELDVAPPLLSTSRGLSREALIKASPQV
uniref:C2 domain-containing protein n=1 Tax=Zooxanthella nutricula TaxID=1333877 RepID=A0A7S2MW23_9DINO